MRTSHALNACRRPALRAGLGAVLVAFLVVAQTFAAIHGLDSAAHSNDEPCNVCLSVASLGSGAVAHGVDFAVDSSRPAFVAIAGSILVSTVPTRRSARGPPAVS